jgi:hypothetical protein
MRAKHQNNHLKTYWVENPEEEKEDHKKDKMKNKIIYQQITNKIQINTVLTMHSFSPSQIYPSKL